MGALLKNEWIKMMSKRKTWIVFIALLVLSAFFTYTEYNRWAFRRTNEGRIAIIEDEIDWLQFQLSDLNEAELSLPLAKYLMESIEHYERFIAHLEADKILQAAGEEIDFFPRMLELIEWHEASIINWAWHIDEGFYDGMLNERGQNADITEHAANIKLIEYLLEHDLNIDPARVATIGSYRLQNFDFFTTFEVLDLALGPSLFILIVIFVLIADSVSGESTPPTFKFLLTQPISRKKVLLAKCIIALIVVTLFVMSAPLVMALISGMFHGFSSGNLPRLVDATMVGEPGSHFVTTFYDTAHIITQSTYTGRLLLHQFVINLTATMTAILFSTIFKSSMIAFAASLLFTISAEIFSLFRPVGIIVDHTVFALRHVEAIITFNGHYSRALGRTIPMMMIYLILIAGFFIPLILSNWLFKKRDISV